MLIMAALLVGLWTGAGQAEPILSLSGSAYNLDGVISYDDLSGLSGTFDSTTGLGTLSASVEGAGSHYVALFMDYDINDFYDDELGAVVGTPPTGLSYSVADPYSIDIALPLEGPPVAGGDIAMALGWSFDLAAGETGIVTFGLSTLLPGAGQFYIQQVDPYCPSESGCDSLYFTARLDKQSVPEPSALLLVGSGLGGILLLRKRLSA